MIYEIATFQFGCTIAQHLICPSFKAMHNQFQRYVHQQIEHCKIQFPLLLLRVLRVWRQKRIMY